jgi:hypothetical protein
MPWRNRWTANWAGARLVAAVSGEEVARRHRAVLAAVAVSALGYCLGVASSGSFTGYLAGAAVIGTAAETLRAMYLHASAQNAADQLIEQRFPYTDRSDAVGQALQARVETLTCAKQCQQLAGLLRWYLDLERHAAENGVRCQPVPPIRGLAEHGALVEEIAELIESSRPDPRAAIRIHRLLTAPPGSALHMPDGQDVPIGNALSSVRSLLGTPHQLLADDQMRRPVV